MLEYKESVCVKEAVIQSKLYESCEKAGLVCDLQYVVFLDGKKEKCVLDLVVIENYQIIAIVEVKDQEDNPDRIRDSKQLKRYKQFGVPVFILYSIYDIPHLIKRLVKIQQNYLKSISETSSIFGKNEKRSEDRWEEKINKAIDEFNKIFPNYEFTNEHSLETIATAVKVLGLNCVLSIICYPNRKVEDFFFYLNSRLDYIDRGKKGTITLNRRNSTLQTERSHEYKLYRIDRKLN
jgi:hypothetical protein